MFRIDLLYEAGKTIHSWGESVYNDYYPFHHQDVTGFSDNNAENWLYHSETWGEKDYNLFAVLYNLPVVRNYIDYLYDKRAGEEYLSRYPVDVHDPRKLPGGTSSSGSVALSGLNYVSRNLARLYRD